MVMVQTPRNLCKEDVMLENTLSLVYTAPETWASSVATVWGTEEI